MYSHIIVCVPNRCVTQLQAALRTFDFQTQKYWIWVGVAYCLFLFVLLTLAGAVGLRYTDPPHDQPTVPAEIAASTLKRRRSEVLGENFLATRPRV